MKFFKKIVSVSLCIIIILGGVPIGELFGMDLRKSLGIKAHAYSAGDKVYFGTYPQNEVTDKELISVLSAINPDSNGDLIYSGTKYRRFKSIYGLHYYKYSSIKWVVLYSNDYEMYIVSERVLDCKKYNDTNDNVTWSNCTLRTWLNSTFYNTAFSETDKKMIKRVTLTNDSNPRYGTDGGENTTDYVFIPSYNDVMNSNYGFSTSTNASDTRIVIPTVYACDAGATPVSTTLGSVWSLRTPGHNNSSACFVDYEGGVNNFGFDVYKDFLGIRPALKIKFRDDENTLCEDKFPTLSHEDAVDFLSFIFNMDLSVVDLSDFILYRYITGDIFKSNISDETKIKLYSSFCISIQSMLNKHINDYSYSSNLLRDSLISLLEEKIESVSQDFIEDVTVDGVLALLKDKSIASCGLDCSEEILMKACESYSKEWFGPFLIDLFDYVLYAFNGSLFVLSEEYTARYKYFNTYLNNRSLSNKENFNFIMDNIFWLLSQKHKAGSWINIIPGKDSWIKRRDDIDRWAEYVYLLTEYMSGNHHSYKKTVVKPSCTSHGYTINECIICGYITNNDYKEATGHCYTKSIVKETCIKDGFVLYKCKNCTHSYTSDIIPATGHTNYTVETVISTCIDGGYDLYSCACGANWQDSITNSKGHTYVSTVVEPTEFEQGYIYHRCTVCSSEYYSDYTDPLGHSFTTVVTEPTCETDGYTTHTCVHCDYQYVDSIIKSDGCRFAISEQEKSTCILAGYQKYSCEVCGKSYTENLPIADHDYSYSLMITEATCSEGGYTIHSCKCGETLIDDYVNARGHNYVATEQNTITCTEDGITVYECSNCNDVYTETDYSQGHQFEVIETVDATCQSCGYTLRVCSVCGSEHYSDLILPKDHTLGDWVVLKDEDGCLLGQREAKCINCDFTYTEDNPSYNANFYIDGVICDSYECEYGDVLPVPEVPHKEYYTFVGWTPAIPETMPEHDITFNAVFELATYTATFIVDDTVISTQTFTFETESLDEPPIPQKLGYNARWSAYELKAEDIIIEAIYQFVSNVLLISRRTLNVGETYRILPSCNFDATDKKWVSSNPSVATVSQHGKVTAVGEGKCKITVTCYGKDSLGNDIQASDSTQIIVNGVSENQETKRSFRELFDEFFEVTIHDFLYNLREFMKVLFLYAY